MRRSTLPQSIQFACATCPLTALGRARIALDAAVISGAVVFGVC